MSKLLKNCPTYVINLIERNDKKSYIEKLFNKQKIKFEFYRPTKNESNPKRGCLESHLHLIKNAIKNNYEKILIFEDDVKFLKSIHEIKEPPNDWNMIYLGGTVHRVMDTKNKDYTRVQTWTTHAYFINLKDKEFVNKIMEMEDYNEEVDRFYLEKIHPKYKCYMTNPMMAIQKEDYSDIEKREVNYDFMQYTLNGLRLPEHEVDKNGNYVLKLDNIKLSDLPKISIITPTYKRRKLFSMALNNYENFIYPKNKIEWVIVDDSPRDGECVEDLVSHMKNVKYIRFRSDEEPMTIASKRNIGVSNASNNYIIHMDDDDYYPPESLLARIKLLLKYEKDGIECLGSTLIGTYNILTNTSSMSTDSPISLSEASMAYTKKFWERRGFDDLCVRGEHKHFTENRFEQILDIPYSFILIAINHRNNMTNELRGDDCLLKFSENNEKFGEVANFFDTWDMDTQMFIIELRKYIL
jgi:GR25 family glycosyltransferase involved in LPS biosynthesis